MKKRPFENKIIIIGADHHNTLAAIRAFGKENCEIAVVIHGQRLQRNKIQVFSSKYVDQKQAYLIENNADALLEVLNHYGNLYKKDVLFPTSDFAEYIIDSNFESLTERFIIPGFVSSPGKVCQMMDKWNQYLFAQEHDIPMAPTYLIQTESPQIPSDLTFPCLVKPRISAFGSKTDIKVCVDLSELLGALKHYQEAHYNDLILQQFVPKKYEVLSMGGITNTPEECFVFGGAFIKIREQLESATSFALFVIDNTNINNTGNNIHSVFPVSEYNLYIKENEWNQLVKMNQTVVSILASNSYQGQYDVEYLLCDDKVYLNEINFRQSGAGYALINKYVNAPYVWASRMLGFKKEKYSNLRQSVEIGSFFMAELCDIIYIKRRVLTLTEWIRDIKKASFFAVFDRNDLKATIRIYNDFAIGFVKRNVIRKHTV